MSENNKKQERVNEMNDDKKQKIERERERGIRLRDSTNNTQQTNSNQINLLKFSFSFSPFRPRSSSIKQPLFFVPN